jgi:molybdopterin converting factor small subunit
MKARLRLFAAAREAAGRSADEFELPAAACLDDLLRAASERYGTRFTDVLAASRVWLNGDEPAAGPRTVLGSDDEVAVLPPVSGGARA